jgi:hypothetical protein
MKAAEVDTRKAVAVSLTAILLLFAVWLVSPFFTIEAADAERGKENGYRLALGLTILLAFVGKWFFDVLAPQGLAKQVSNVKAVALMVLSIGILGFIVFIVARAASLYLSTAWSETTLDL